LIRVSGASKALLPPTSCSAACSSSPPFVINADNGIIYPRANLREAPCLGNQYLFQVVAIDRGLPAQTSNPATVEINIYRNTNGPQWLESTYRYNIDSSINVGANLGPGNPTARDNDPVDRFGTLRYSVIRGDGILYFNIFQVNNNEVSVVVTGDIPSSTKQTYTLVLLVQDNGLPPKQDITTVVINVNRNLNPPEFTQFTYNFNAFENDPVGTNIGSRLLGQDIDT
jgi:hypothetical protein